MNNLENLSADTHHEEKPPADIEYKIKVQEKREGMIARAMNSELIDAREIERIQRLSDEEILSREDFEAANNILPFEQKTGKDSVLKKDII